MGRTSARLSTVLPPASRAAIAMASQVGQRCLIAAAQRRRLDAGQTWCESSAPWSWIRSAKLFFSVTIYAPILRWLLEETYSSTGWSGVGRKVERGVEIQNPRSILAREMLYTGVCMLPSLVSTGLRRVTHRDERVVLLTVDGSRRERGG